MVASIGGAVDAAEEALFVGRTEETAAFERALATCSALPRALYVHGPAGVGKTTLLRAWARRGRRRGMAVVAVDGAAAGASPEWIALRIADGLCLSPVAGRLPPSAEAVLCAANARARAEGLLLLLDTYEALLPYDRWLRAHLLYGLGPGCCVVLAGRRCPEDLWAEDPGWLATVQSLRLPGLSADEAVLLLSRRGVQAPASVKEAVGLAGGRPLLLSLAATVIVQSGGKLPAASPSAPSGALALALLAHLTHHAPHLERLLPTTALVPTFDRELLAAMVDDEVAESAWADLCALPVITPIGRRHALHEAVRDPLATAAFARRPWVARDQRRRAIEHQLLRESGATAWAAVAHLASHALWHSWLHPRREEEEGWCLTQGAMAADLPVMARLLALVAPTPMMGASPDEVGHEDERVAALMAAWPAGFVMARDANAALLGYLATVPARPETRAVLLREPRAGPYVETWPPEAWDGSSLILCHVGLRAPDSEVANALFREAICTFAPYRRVVAVTPDPQAQNTLPRLGFQRDAAFAGTVRGTAVPTTAFVLDLGSGGYSTWLRHLAGLAEGKGPPETEWVSAAQAALAALQDDVLLVGSAAARSFAAAFGSLEPSMVREWIRDSLATVERRLDPLGGAALRLYYLERAGSHESLAERLRLPPRSYFRRRKAALAALGEILFRP